MGQSRRAIRRSRTSTRAAPLRRGLASAHSATVSPMPSRRPKTSPFIQPLELGEQDKPPSGDAWVHEIKWDGYRVQAHVTNGQATIYTRGGHDWTRQFRPIAEAVRHLPVTQLILDGEAVVLGASGRADFHALRAELDGRSSRLRLYAFDLLMLNGKDLRPRPLIERKARLQALLANVPATLVFVEHMSGDSSKILAHACQMGVEGIVSKRAASPYQSGRSTAWVKTKCYRTATLAVVGFAVERGAVACLHVAWRTGGRLIYAGAVERGIGRADGPRLLEMLRPLVRPRAVVTTKAKATWVDPRISVEVTFPNASEGGRLRHPKFAKIVPV